MFLVVEEACLDGEVKPTQGDITYSLILNKRPFVLNRPVTTKLISRDCL